MRRIESYNHSDKERLNNPPAGLVSPQSDPDGETTTYSYDPHLDPQLVWAGKAEHTSFDVPTVSLHVHERIDPRTIIEAVQTEDEEPAYTQPSLFDSRPENPPLRQAIEFYQHRHGWSNRLVAGDSLLVMNSLLEKEGLGGQVQMIYIDPPYGIKYGSNFQPFVNKRDVRDGRDEDLTSEPEMLQAFRDTWELGLHSYLSYLRDRLLLSRELLTESGSCFVQISSENVHHVREILDEVFGPDNFVAEVVFAKTSSATTKQLPTVNDFLLWYARDIKLVKFRRLFQEKPAPINNATSKYDQLELADGTRRSLTTEEKAGRQSIPEKARIYRLSGMDSMTGSEASRFPVTFEGQDFTPSGTRGWSTSREGIEKLMLADRVQKSTTILNYVRFFDDHPVRQLSNVWMDIGGAVQSRSDPKVYVVQTGTAPVQRCLLMTTDPGDLVFDPTCGSGTTAYVAEEWGRRWITCDTSRVAVTLAKQRLMTAAFDYYDLAYPQEGVGSGFKYKTVPHITLKSIANNPDIREGMTRAEIDAAIAKHAPQETLYDQPEVDRGRARVTGPFTVEAVPSATVQPLDDGGQTAAQTSEVSQTSEVLQTSVARSGETLRQAEWRDELLRTGIRGKAGQHIRFARLEALPGTRYLHADGETRPSDEGAGTVRESGPEYATASNVLRAVVSFGPEHAPLDAKQVENALFEAERLRPKPKLLIFAAFQFDPEASKDIDATNWPGVTLLKAQMNPDLFTDDLKKKRSSNESFWLIGQPDVELAALDGDQYRVSVHGFDYYNTKTGQIESGGSDKIAMWLLDTDYDGRSLYPRQVFFPMAGRNEGWARLARNLKAEIDDDLIEAYQGTESLPFKPGEHRQAAVKIIDDRGIESLKIVELD